MNTNEPQDGSAKPPRKVGILQIIIGVALAAFLIYQAMQGYKARQEQIGTDPVQVTQPSR